jgi:hypothetical protein
MAAWWRYHLVYSMVLMLSPQGFAPALGFSLAPRKDIIIGHLLNSPLMFHDEGVVTSFTPYYLSSIMFYLLPLIILSFPITCNLKPSWYPRSPSWIIYRLVVTSPTIQARPCYSIQHFDTSLIPKCNVLSLPGRATSHNVSQL